MFGFPDVLALPPPFPKVLMQSLETSFVAPGVSRATYRLATADGPLVIYVVAVNPHERTIRIEARLAEGHLISAGQTVSSMANADAAGTTVAGINGDYFDIGNTNQPLNILVRGGTLVRTPSKRYALDVRRDGSVHFERFTFSGTVAYDGARVPLTGINEWPPEGGATLLTPAYGALKAAPGVLLAALQPVASQADATTPQLPGIAPVQSVAAIAPSSAQPTGPLSLGLGPAALALAPAPKAGDTVTIGGKLDPPLDDVTTAIGGGPLLVQNAQPVDDPFAPAPEERDRRFPVSGAAVALDGSLLLIAVDGRQPALSVGLTRPEFGALMLGLGAVNGMAFDSGGSATLAARVLGDRDATVLNAPSDGVERPVADGLFIASDAPYGDDPRLVVRPGRFSALPGATIAFKGSIVDAAGHLMRVATIPALHVTGDAGIRPIRVFEPSTTYSASVTERIVSHVTSLRVESEPPNPDPGERVVLHVRASDDDGTPVALGDAVRFSASGVALDPSGALVAPAHDATIVATAGGATASYVLRVGRHDEPLALFAPPAAARWSFASAPKGGPGSLAFPIAGELRLDYDFTSGTRAAYAGALFPLPGEPISFGVVIDGDGSGVAARAAFLNRFGEREALTLAKRVDWHGPRLCSVLLPDDLNPPVTLSALYVVPSLGGAPVLASGTIGFRDASVVLPGTP